MTTRVEINPCPPETDDEELEMKRDLLKAALKHMDDAQAIYEQKLMDRRERIMLLEETIQHLRQQLSEAEAAQTGSPLRGSTKRTKGPISRGEMAEDHSHQFEIADEVVDWDNNLEDQVSALREKYNKMLLYYLEHQTVLDAVIEQKENAAQQIRSKLSSMGWEVKSDRDQGRDKKKSSIVSRSDFTVVSIAGEGAFGKVLRVKYKDHKDEYAMKVMHKARVIERDQLHHTNREREIMSDMKDHPFVVSLHWAFQNDNCVYLVMDYVGGGCLFDYLNDNDGPFSEDTARFFAAETLLGLEALHQNNIVYRDLKLENVLLDNEGHVRLSDFGLSAVVEGKKRIHSFSGTATYLAPEILNDLHHEGHGKSVDAWCFGVMLYTMLMQEPPFWAENLHDLFTLIRTEEVIFEDNNLSDEAEDVLRKLLIKNPKHRLGCGEGGIGEIKDHPFFKSVDWKKLLLKKYAAPIKPTTQKGSVPTGDEEEADEDPNVEDAAQTRDMDLFRGFTYVGIDSGKEPSKQQTIFKKGKIESSKPNTPVQMKRRGSVASAWRKINHNKIKADFRIDLISADGLPLECNDEPVWIKWKLGAPVSKKLSFKAEAKGRVHGAVVSERSASWMSGTGVNAKSEAVISFTVMLNQDSQTLKFGDQRLSLSLMSDSLKKKCLGKVYIDLPSYARHNQTEKQILPVEKTNATIMVKIRCEWKIFNGKKLIDRLITGERLVAGTILHLEGRQYYLV